MAGITGPEDSPMCSICVDTFRDPVTHPCQHSFCRSCLQMFAEQTPSVQTGSEVDHVISCPVCRTPANLGSTGVAGLPTDVKLGEVTERVRGDSRSTGGVDIPLCVMCEGEARAAVKFCPSCGVLYCERCLNVMHPMRGPLGRHQLVSMEEYMSMGSTEGHVVSAGEIPEDKNPFPLHVCDQHSQPLSIFCTSCQKLICTGCLSQHDQHAMRSLQTACGELKAPLVEKTEQCEKVSQELMKTISGWTELENDVKQNGELHTVDIEKAYSSGLEALNKWRVKSLDTVKTQEEEWTRQCKASGKELEMMTEQLQNLMTTSHHLTSSSDDTQFVQDAGVLTTRMDNQLAEVRMTMKKQAERKEKLLSDLEDHSIFGRNIIVKEEKVQTMKEAKHPDVQRVEKPEFKFTRTNDTLGRLEISDGGSVVAGHGTRRGCDCEAWTDGCLQTGRVYWELELSVCLSPQAVCYCFTGVVREGGDLTGGDGWDCWYMGMRYRGYHFRCDSHQGGAVSPAYQDDRHSTGAQRLGVFLDCEAQTLTFMDCTNNRVMCTVRGVCVSGPGLYPAVRFRTYYNNAAISARLVTGDRATLPQVLSDRL